MILRESWPRVQEDESTRWVKATSRGGTLAQLKKERNQPTKLAFSKGRGESNQCLLKEKQMEGKFSKVKKHHCGLFHKNQQSCGFSRARALKGKENRDHISGHSRA